MRFYRLNSDKMVWVNINKYKIDWTGKSISRMQTRVKRFLAPFWQSHIVLEEFRIPGSLYRIDILNLTTKIAVEVSPESVHSKFNPFFHKTRSGYVNSIKRDVKKAEWCERNEIKVIEIYEQDFPLTRNFFAEKFNILL